MEIIENNANNHNPEDLIEANRLKRREIFENKIRQVIREEQTGQRTSGHFDDFDIEKMEELTDGDMELYELVEQFLGYSKITEEQVNVLFGLLKDHHITTSADPNTPKNRELFLSFLNNYAGSKINLKLYRQNE